MVAADTEPRIGTERLVLRPPRLDDAVYLADLANDLDVARMTTRIPHPYSLADARAYIARVRSESAHNDRPLLIDHREFGPVGLIGLHRESGAPLSEIGYWLGRTFRGRGFATEAVSGVLNWAREGLGKRAVTSSHFADNAASARVLEKTGFLYTGEVQSRFSCGRQVEVATRMMVWLA